MRKKPKRNSKRKNEKEETFALKIGLWAWSSGKIFWRRDVRGRL
jgi:hypothetical protein